MLNIFKKSNIKIQGFNNIYNYKIIKKSHALLDVNGDNNQIFISNKVSAKKLKILINGNNNVIKIADGVIFNNKTILSIGCAGGKKVNDSEIVIGDNGYIGSCDMLIYENNSHIHIGNKCLLSDNIIMRTSDTHSILDIDNNLLNRGMFIEIGDKVWIGMDCKIGKNVKISDNSIVGWGSVVTKSFEKSNIIIAGIPAKIIKEDIHWSGESPDLFVG